MNPPDDEIYYISTNEDAVPYSIEKHQAEEKKHLMEYNKFIAAREQSRKMVVRNRDPDAPPNSPSNDYSPFNKQGDPPNFKP